MSIQGWQQQCHEIQNACSNSNWSQVIHQCNELIQYAQQQSGVTTETVVQNNALQSYENNEQQLQLHIQAHAEQD